MQFLWVLRPTARFGHAFWSVRRTDAALQRAILQRANARELLNRHPVLGDLINISWRDKLARSGPVAVQIYSGGRGMGPH